MPTTGYAFPIDMAIILPLSDQIKANKDQKAIQKRKNFVRADSGVGTLHFDGEYFLI